jgi:hypothetical protein
MKDRILQTVERASLLKDAQPAPAREQFWWAGTLARAAVIILAVGAGAILLNSLSGPTYTDVAMKTPDAVGPGAPIPARVTPPAAPVVSKAESLSERLGKGGDADGEEASRVSVVINTKDMERTRRDVEAVLRRNGVTEGVNQLQAGTAATTASGAVTLADQAKKQVITFSAPDTQVRGVVRGLCELRVHQEAEVVLPDTDEVYAAADTRGRGAGGERVAASQSAAPGAGAGAAQTKPAAVEYFCPMHPKIVKAEPGNCPICGMPLMDRAPAAATTAPARGPAPSTQPATLPATPASAPTPPVATDLKKAVQDAPGIPDRSIQSAQPAQAAQGQSAQQANRRQMVIILNSVPEKVEAVTIPSARESQPTK